MASREYQTVLQSFDWKEARAALGWNEDRTVSLGDALVDRHANSGRTALISASIDGTETQMTFAELANASNQFANLLTRMGIGPGDRVAGLMPRGPEVFITILGTLKAGAIYVPIFTGFGPDAVGYRLEQSQAKLLITDLEYYDRIPGDASVKRIVVAPANSEPAGTFNFQTALEEEEPIFTPVLRERDDPAAIIYTSGSTGQPKGGTLAVNFLAAINPYIVYGLGLTPSDILWSTGDPGWGYGFVCYLGALAMGATVLTVRQNPSAEQCLAVIDRYDVTNLATTPTLLRSIMLLPHEKFGAKKLKLRAISSCGEPLNAKVIDAFRQALDITPMDHFGATEYALPIGNYNAIPMEVKAGSMGLPSPGYRMAIIDEQGNELPVGEVGFIAKRADADCRYWLKYWNDPAASSALLIEGWIVTRDLGRIDEEGYFWFEGRADDMIKSSGYRIGPFEVESALLKHPAVAEAAVIGQPDEMRGQIVKAFVVLRDGFTGTDELSEELVTTVKTNVGRHQFPRVIQYVDSLPKTETGKIQRFQLRARAS
ncbi:AMP-binding protein [Ensifer adhaerens]|uniref:acyl-CoA synthetase n=1 Tax=Ensifer adhaerens TaxID=106592 RepID=UPI001CBF488E|nr:AMP-binding protein [Ensifer adhaerens]MBZ7924258.1 AMP-binding protein [Ensifer adhaerens]UAX96489.1 AMP-binding protein [Ensifer adhaerens]UAY04168.1 AMP-binding protein [Ensifer adhaerens]UAY12154.1 AMP-binding protein [Ensifer adhaerens]